jgi:hypothetical protein
VFCSWGRFRAVTFKVADCTDYANRNVPFSWEFEKMALLINVEPARNRAGFKSGAGFAPPAEEEEDRVSATE